MPNLAQKHKVILTPEQRAVLQAEARKTAAGVARVRRATILLMADEGHADGHFRDWQIAEKVGICERQVVRIRQQFVREGAATTLVRATRVDAGVQRALDGKAEAHLITLACSTPPAGQDHWTLQLLCDELARLEVVVSVCRETVRKCLKKTGLSLGTRPGSALRKRTGPASSPAWKRSSTSTRSPSTRSTP